MAISGTFVDVRVRLNYRGVHLIKVSFKVNIREINLETWLLSA